MLKDSKNICFIEVGNLGFGGHNRGLCKKCGKFHKGVHHTEEAKRRIGDANRKNRGWCSGLTKETDERIRQISLKSGRYTRTNEHRKFLSNKLIQWHRTHKNHYEGKHLSQETKDKIRNSLLQTYKNPEIIEKYRKARLKQTPPPNQNTGIEKLIASELTKHGIPFEQAVVIGKYQTDFLIHNRLIVECDGEPWHNYPFGLEKDHRRDSELSSQGFTTIRFWGNDIKTNVSACVNKIEEKIQCMI